MVPAPTNPSSKSKQASSSMDLGLAICSSAKKNILIPEHQFQLLCKHLPFRWKIIHQLDCSCDLLFYFGQNYAECEGGSIFSFINLILKILILTNLLLKAVKNSCIGLSQID